MVMRLHCLSSFFCLILGMISLVQAQMESDLDFIITHNPIEPIKERELSPISFKETNEIKLLLMGTIRMYQRFISSQDLSVCNFTPSCSRFGLAAIKKYGIMYGSLMTFDRLQRCHGLGSIYYPTHAISGKAHDPIDHNFIKKK